MGMDEQEAYVVKALSDMGIVLEPGCRALSFESKMDVMDVSPVGGGSMMQVPTQNLTLSLVVGNYNFNTIEYHEYCLTEDANGKKGAILVAKNVDLSNAPLPGPPPAVPAPMNYEDWVTGKINDLYDPNGIFAFTVFTDSGDLNFRVAGPINPSIQLVQICNMIAELRTEKFIKYRWADQFRDNMNKAKTFPLVQFHLVNHLNYMLKDGFDISVIDIKKWEVYE